MSTICLEELPSATACQTMVKPRLKGDESVLLWQTQCGRRNQSRIDGWRGFARVWMWSRTLWLLMVLRKQMIVDLANLSITERRIRLNKLLYRVDVCVYYFTYIKFIIAILKPGSLHCYVFGIKRRGWGSGFKILISLYNIPCDSPMNLGSKMGLMTSQS